MRWKPWKKESALRGPGSHQGLVNEGFERSKYPGSHKESLQILPLVCVCVCVTRCPLLLKVIVSREYWVVWKFIFRDGWKWGTCNFTCEQIKHLEVKLFPYQSEICSTGHTHSQSQTWVFLIKLTSGFIWQYTIVAVLKSVFGTCRKRHLLIADVSSKYKYESPVSVLASSCFVYLFWSSLKYNSRYFKCSSI